MRDGFIKVAAATPQVTVADCEANANEILGLIRRMDHEGVKIMVFPELCITGYTCSDLFLQDQLLQDAKIQLFRIMRETSAVDALIFIGLPLEVRGKLYNVAAVLHRGYLLGLVPKTYLPNYNEFYECRHFSPAPEHTEWINFSDSLPHTLPNYRSAGSAEDYSQKQKPVKIPFGTKLLFQIEGMPHLTVAAEICEDLWVPDPPSTGHALAGATILVNLSASNEMIGKSDYRRLLVQSHSARLICGYIYASAGEGESTTDIVFGGHNLIAENGTLLKEAPSFDAGIAISEIDVDRLMAERRRTSTYQTVQPKENGYTVITYAMKPTQTVLTRTFPARPFVPADDTLREERCREILNIQSYGLKKCLEHTHSNSAVIGLSGGLDSTLALLVTVQAVRKMEKKQPEIIAVTMPCFGTTDRTYQNACQLATCLGATLKKVNIKEAVRTHFRDIEHDEKVHDVTYENGQARERTQILMDIANQTGGLVIGTGDLSELALGWATYNGDHMSMYGVNSSIPKTLVRHLVAYYADICEDSALSAVLYDILDTPVSPELLPPEHGDISQKTEDLVGPYELHDFFLYYMVRAGFPPKKIFRIACETFCREYETDKIDLTREKCTTEESDLSSGKCTKGDSNLSSGKHVHMQSHYDPDVILHWEKIFYRRFFAQQFKRSCLPDGPKVGSVALSPRGDWRMPSDASVQLWLNELEHIAILDGTI